jgi:proteasome lid subunit RPN8/RPN11
MLVLHRDRIEEIFRHVASCYPEEGCGLLIGTIQENSCKMVCEVRPAENVWTENGSFDRLEFDLLESDRDRPLILSKRNRYCIDPAVLLRTQKDCRDRHLSILGIFHSHPDAPAIPSESDRAIAWSDYSYVIVSVEAGISKDLTSWELDSDRTFRAEIVEAINELPS